MGDTIIHIEYECEHECPICLNDFDTNLQDTIIVKCCKKQFHIECYVRCMNQKKECPMCRAVNTTFNTSTIFPPVLQTPLITPYIHTLANPRLRSQTYNILNLYSEQNNQVRCNELCHRIKPLCIVSIIATVIIVCNSYFQFI